MQADDVLGLYRHFKEEGLTPSVISAFQGMIWQYYGSDGRSFPWRDTCEPYNILVSEIMLQQTQVSRVLGKYEEFLAAFPDFGALAGAALPDVLRVWQGLGYNRRAMSLKQTAIRVVNECSGKLPSDPDVLQGFPGIGRYTAGAIAAIAFNRPAVFIDTNIRTVYLACFFRDVTQVSDRSIMPVVEATLDTSNPREWYFALFDYGTRLKQERVETPQIQKIRPEKFHGSNRQLRGQIIRHVLQRTSVPESELYALAQKQPDRVRETLSQLQQEGFLEKREGNISIKP